VTAVSTAPASAALRPETIVAHSGSNFLTGFVCLDPARRAGMTAIYAFCRVADDAVDEAPDALTGERHLAFWRGELAAAAAGAATTPVGAAVQAAMQRFGVPAGPLGDLLDGVATDLSPRPFADDAELHRYCYRVAAAVGLACLPVLGATSDGAREFADALGHALQRTNILRDLRGDAEQGRCYVPAPWLAAAGVRLDWLAGRGPDSAYEAGGPVAGVCERLAVAASEQFARARAALRALPRRERRALVPARIMGAVYGELLVKLRARGGELRGGRVRVPRARKLWLALQVLGGVRP
jgi:phytoene/squalene synthetase